MGTPPRHLPLLEEFIHSQLFSEWFWVHKTSESAKVEVSSFPKSVTRAHEDQEGGSPSQNGFIISQRKNRQAGQRSWLYIVFIPLDFDTALSVHATAERSCSPYQSHVISQFCPWSTQILEPAVWFRRDSLDGESNIESSLGNKIHLQQAQRKQTFPNPILENFQTRFLIFWAFRVSKCTKMSSKMNSKPS